MTPPAPQNEGAQSPRAGLAALVALRGAPLLEGLESHASGAAAHANATASSAFIAATRLGLPGEEAQLVREVARLHEVGMVYGSPQSDDPRYEDGAALARGAGLPEEFCAWILHARERFDGRGPGKLSGEEIPRASRIIRAACRSSAISAPGGDARAEPEEERWGDAVRVLRREAGRELDPEVVAALVAVLEQLAASPD